MKLLLAILCCGLFLVAVSHPAGAVSCHCFQDRSFDPARPGAADAYFLATTRNSLMAAALDVPRRTIVKARMGGIDADLLWVVYYVADRTGMSVNDLFELRADSGVEDFVTRLDNLSLQFDRPFLMKIKPQSDIAALADGTFEAVVLEQLGLPKPVFERLEMTGATRREKCLAIFVSLLLAEEPTKVYRSVQEGRLFWGEALASTGISSDQIESTWKKLIEINRRGL